MTGAHTHDHDHDHDESPLETWAVHNLGWVIFALTVWSVADHVYQDREPVGAVSVTVVLVSIFLWVNCAFRVLRLARDHSGKVCVRCFTGTPDDPAGEVARRLFALRLYHANRLEVCVAIGLPIAAGFVGGLLVPGPLWFLLVEIPTVVALSAGVFPPATHRRLAPWCPYCRRGPGDDDDGGDREPVPDPSASKTVDR